MVLFLERGERGADFGQERVPPLPCPLVDWVFGSTYTFVPKSRMKFDLL